MNVNIPLATIQSGGQIQPPAPYQGTVTSSAPAHLQPTQTYAGAHPAGPVNPPASQEPMQQSQLATQVGHDANQANPVGQAVISKQPWKDIGYQMFAEFLASSDDAVILRRFDELHARVLLYMQDHIVEREERLRELDRLTRLGTHKYMNGSLRYDASTAEWQHERTLILETLKKELDEYDKFILTHRQLRSEPDPPERNVENIKEWFHNRGYRPEKLNSGPITNVETEFINKTGDLVSLVPKAKAPLRSLMEKVDKLMLLPIFKLKSTTGKQYHDAMGTTRYQSDETINKAITTLTLGLGLAALIGPLWILNSLNTDEQKLGAISGLIALFAILLGMVMVSQPFETLAATAAYAAVLMVFLQLGQSTNSGSASTPNCTCAVL